MLKTFLRNTSHRYIIFIIFITEKTKIEAGYYSKELDIFFSFYCMLFGRSHKINHLANESFND